MKPKYLMLALALKCFSIPSFAETLVPLYADEATRAKVLLDHVVSVNIYCDELGDEAAVNLPVDGVGIVEYSPGDWSLHISGREVNLACLYTKRDNRWESVAHQLGFQRFGTRRYLPENLAANVEREWVYRIPVVIESLERSRESGDGEFLLVKVNRADGLEGGPEWVSMFVADSWGRDTSVFAPGYAVELFYSFEYGHYLYDAASGSYYRLMEDLSYVSMFTQECYEEYAEHWRHPCGWVASKFYEAAMQGIFDRLVAGVTRSEQALLLSSQKEWQEYVEADRQRLIHSFSTGGRPRGEIENWDLSHIIRYLLQSRVHALADHLNHRVYRYNEYYFP